MKKSDLTFVISDMGSGGAQKVLQALVTHWDKKGRTICVITFSEPSTDFFQLPSHVRRITIGGISQSSSLLNGLASNFHRIRNLRAALVESGAPIAVGFVGTTNILLILASVGLGVRTIISERNDPARQSLGNFWDFLRKHLYRYADTVTANSKGAVTSLSAFVPAKKLYYVPNPLLLPDADRSFPKKNIILAVGRLEYQKAYDVLLKAFAVVSKQEPEWRLVICGDGTLRESLHRMAEELGLTETVQWMGKRHDLEPFFSSASIFVMPSRFEGTPNAMLEAMSYGLPVIVSDASPGPLQYVVHEQTGMVVKSEEPNDLAKAMIRLIRDSQIRELLATQALGNLRQSDLVKAFDLWENVLGF